MSGVRGNGAGCSAPRVKEALAALRIATVRQIAAWLDVPDADYRSRKQVRSVLRDMKAHGQVRVEMAHGELFYAWTDKAGRRGAKQSLLWRAMTTSPHGFTISEMAMLAGTDRDYAKRYIGWLRLEDWLEERGQRVLETGIKARVYRIVPGKEDAPAPVWNRRGEARKKDTGTRGRGDAGQETVRGILVEMEKALVFANVGVASARELLSEMRADLGISPPETPEEGGA